MCKKDNLIYYLYSDYVAIWEEVMTKKRIISFITAFVMTLTVCFSMVSTSLAAGANITTTASPNELTGAGNVDITVEIENNYGSDMVVNSVKIGSTNDSTALTIASGDTKKYKYYDYPISSSQLGNPLKITVYYSVGTADYAKEDSVTIAKKVVQPEVSLTRVCNVSSQIVGDTVEFTYTVKNEGTEKIQNVVLHDSYQESALNSSFSLNSGQSKNIKVTHVMESTVASRPSVSFTSGGQNFIDTIDTLYVSAQDEPLLVDLSASATSGNLDDEITLSCKVTNQSGQKISNINVKDENGDSFGSTFSLNAGDSKTVTKTIKLAKNRDIQAMVTGVTKQGNSISTESEVVSLEISQDGDNSTGLSLSVKTDRTQLEEGGGEVEFEITVSNTRSVQLNNVVISEAGLGEVTTIDALPTGDKLVLKTYELTENQTFTFSATATDADGNTYNITAEPVEILVGAQVTPTPTVGADQQAGSVGGLLLVVIIIVVVAIVVGIVLLVLVQKERKEKKLAQESGETEQIDSADTTEQTDNIDQDGTADPADEFYDDQESVVPPEIEQDEFEDLGEIDSVDDIDNANNDTEPRE